MRHCLFLEVVASVIVSNLSESRMGVHKLSSPIDTAQTLRGRRCKLRDLFPPRQDSECPIISTSEDSIPNHRDVEGPSIDLPNQDNRGIVERAARQPAFLPSISKEKDEQAKVSLSWWLMCKVLAYQFVNSQRLFAVLKP